MCEVMDGAVAVCEECGGMLVHEGGCIYCANCGGSDLPLIAT